MCIFRVKINRVLQTHSRFISVLNPTVFTRRSPLCISKIVYTHGSLDSIFTFFPLFVHFVLFDSTCDCRGWDHTIYVQKLMWCPCVHMRLVSLEDGTHLKGVLI